jgi:hypothetical protein
VVDAEARVEVVEARPGGLLDLRWDDGQPLRISFADHPAGTVVTVRVIELGRDSPAATAVESMSGFTLALASLKMYLEDGIEGELMYDKFPDATYADTGASAPHSARLRLGVWW